MTLKSPLIKKLWDKFGQFIKFAIVGLSNSIIAIIVYNFYIFVIDMPLFFISSISVAYSLAFLLSVGNGYYWSRKYVFSGKGSKAEITKFFVQYLITYFLGLGLIHLFCSFGIHESISQLLQTTITCVINYFGSKFLVFKKAKENKQ